MKYRILIIAALILFTGGNSFAQNRAEDEKAIRNIIQSLADAWTAGDGVKFGEPFTEDADYVVVNGLHLKGREAIAQGHQRIFDTIYKDTKLKTEIRKIRFLRPDVAVVHTQGSIAKKTEAFPGAPGAFPGFVLSKENGKWQIVAFQNTANAEIEANRK